MRVRMSGSAHEGDAGDDLPLAVRAYDLLGTDPVQDRDDRCLREATGELTGCRLEPGRLRRDDRHVERRERAGVVARDDGRLVLGLAAHAKSTFVQCVGVFAPSGKHGDLAHASQMTREEAPDNARSDDADPFHAASRVSQRGDMSVNRDCS